MSLIYNENVFPEELASRLESYLLDAPWHWGYLSHKSMMGKSAPHWSIIFSGPKIKSEEYYNCESELSGIIKECWDFIKPIYFKDDILVRCYANGVTPGLDQKLHTDDVFPGSKTCIVYVNKEWNADWGGETIIWNKEKRLIENSYLPKYNSVLSIPGCLWHGVRPVSVSYCTSLRITLMFKTRPKLS